MRYFMFPLWEAIGGVVKTLSGIALMFMAVMSCVAVVKIVIWAVFIWKF